MFLELVVVIVVRLMVRLMVYIVRGTKMWLMGWLKVRFMVWWFIVWLM